jgi:hypothetical protein
MDGQREPERDKTWGTWGYYLVELLGVYLVVSWVVSTEFESVELSAGYSELCLAVRTAIE